MKIIKRFRNKIYNKMCKECRGFNNGDNTHCCWCGDDLSYWETTSKKKKKNLLDEVKRDSKNINKEDVEIKNLKKWGF